MIARRFAALVLAATTVGSGAYVATYLVRWEWQRAVFSALVFLAAELAFAAVWLASRMRRLTGPRPWETAAALAAPARPADAAGLREQRIRAALASGRPDHVDPFAWLRATNSQTNVFIPLLLGSGLIFSALAWVLERVAAAMAGRRTVTVTTTALVDLRLPTALVPPRVDPDWAYQPRAWSWTASTGPGLPAEHEAAGSRLGTESPARSS